MPRAALPLRTRRLWLAAALAPLAAGLAAASPVEVWVDLTEPVAAGDPAQAARVASQQQQMAEALAALGAVELARVRHVRNAIAVRIDPARLPEVRALPGVVRVRPARTLHPPRPSARPSA
jgi:hypothetical protein